jgi:dienelactone hydrolase
MNKTVIICLAFLFIFLGCSKQMKSYDKAAGAKLFSYDPGQPLNPQLETIEPENLPAAPPKGIAAYKFSIDYDGSMETVNGFLFEPKAEGVYPAVIFMHWLGGSANVDGGILEFIDEAMSLAEQNFVCIVPEGSFPWMTFPQGDERDVKAIRDQIVELRRVLDFLYQRTNVDRKRIGFIGHDYGAMHGALLVAADLRLRCAVLMTGIGEYWAWNRILNISLGNSDDYKEMLYAYDPLRLIGQAAPTALLFQFSENDSFILKQDAEAFFNAAGQPKKVLWYAWTHELNRNKKARADRELWIKEKLGSQK